MAWNIPRQVANLLVGDDTTQRAIGNVTRALQPVLDFTNSTFTVLQDGSLSFARDVIGRAATLTGLTVNGSASVNGVSRLNGDVSINNGNVVVRTRTGNGVVIVPAGGSPAFYCTNTANNDAVFVVAADGTTSAVSFVSRQGFKSLVWMGCFYHTATAANTQYPLNQVIFNQAMLGGTAQMLRQPTMARAGSITAFILTVNNTVNAVGTYTVYKNGQLFFTVTIPANGIVVRPTYPKGQYPFNAGDGFFVRAAYSASINIATTVDLEIELGA